MTKLFPKLLVMCACALMSISAVSASDGGAAAEEVDRQAEGVRKHWGHSLTREQLAETPLAAALPFLQAEGVHHYRVKLEGEEGAYQGASLTLCYDSAVKLERSVTEAFRVSSMRDLLFEENRPELDVTNVAPLIERMLGEGRDVDIRVSESVSLAKEQTGGEVVILYRVGMPKELFNPGALDELAAYLAEQS